MATDEQKLSDSIDDLTKAIKKLTGNGGGSSASSSTSGSGSMFNQASLKAFDKSITKSVQSLQKFASSADGALDVMTKFASGFLAGELVVGFFNLATSVNKTYEAMADIGQTFGGSMITMGQNAAEAGMSLDQFSKAMTSNSKVVATLGPQGFGKMSKELRSALEPMGQLGFTTEKLNEFMGDYSETLRVQGILSTKNSSQTTENMKNLAIETSGLAAITGKSREQLNKDLQAASKNAGLSAIISNMTLESGTKVSNSFNQAAAVFAAQGGEAGKMLPNALAEMVAAPGIQFTEFGKALAHTGGSLAALQDDANHLRATILSGADATQETIEFNNKLISATKEQTATLNTLNAAGDPYAKSILSVTQGMKELDATQLKSAQAAAQERGSFTNFFANLQTNLQNVVGSFTSGLLKALGMIEDAGTGLDKIDWKYLGQIAGEWGTNLGKFITSPEFVQGLQDIKQGFIDVTGAVRDVIEFFGGIGTLLTPLTLTIKALSQGFSDALLGIRGFIKFLSDKFSWLGLGSNEEEKPSAPGTQKSSLKRDDETWGGHTMRYLLGQTDKQQEDRKNRNDATRLYADGKAKSIDEAYAMVKETNKNLLAQQQPQNTNQAGTGNGSAMTTPNKIPTLDEQAINNTSRGTLESLALTGNQDAIDQLKQLNENMKANTAATLASGSAIQREQKKTSRNIEESYMPSSN